MSQHTQSGPIVFISYAHESDELRASVKALAEWLGQRGCRVLTDHPHIHRPPREGWQAWMLGCIEQADTVLIVCTPRLKARYEKNAPTDSGLGATFEGAIVTQRIYDAAMRNEKFFPVLPDGGDPADIPTTLGPWWNNHRFPSGNEGIRGLIFFPASEGSRAEASRGKDESRRGPSQPGREHERLAARLLGAAGASAFFEALKAEIADEFPDAPPLQSAREAVRWFGQCPADLVQQLFFVVRRALAAIGRPNGGPALRGPAEEAAAALYWLAALRLVDQAARDAVLKVPTGERIICAVIATALGGGELKVVPAEAPGELQPEGIFLVHAPVLGDQFETDFLRAVFRAVFPNRHEATAVSSDSGPLPTELLKLMEARFRTLRHVRRTSLALVVHGFPPTQVCQDFAARWNVHVLIPATEATSILLGMDADTLMAEIREFWNELEVPSRPSSQPAPSPSPGAPPMSAPPVNIHVTGAGASVAVSAASHSAAQAGAGGTAHASHSEAGDLSALIPLLRELMQAIGELPSPKARSALAPHAEAALAEAGKKDKPDPGIVKRAIDAIKPAADALDGTDRIVELCRKTYEALAPFLGLPPL